MAKSIGILYLCTGPYKLFWEDFYNTFQEHFLQNTEKFYYVFSDNCGGTLEKFNNNNHVKLIHIDAMPWPLITLLRFHYFLTVEEDLKQHDYLMFSNANIICNKDVIEDEFLPRAEMGENMSFVNHPGYYFKKAAYNYQFERNRRSLAYIPYNCNSAYVIGAMFVGMSDAFLRMSYVLKSRIEEDLKHNVIARWHDESHMNRYIAGKDDFRLLSPGYCYPVGFDLPVENKIAGVSKMAKFNVYDFKGYTKESNKIIHFIKRVKRRLENEGFIWFLRDNILLKRIDKI